MFHCLSPIVRAETIKACVLISLHLVAAAGGCGFSGSLLIYETCGDTVAQKSPDWDSDGESWSESEGFLRPIFASTMWRGLLCMLSG